jgi:hypothetical protein
MAEQTTIKRVTEFRGQASGDSECFCFDRRTPEEQEADLQKPLPEQVEAERNARIYPSALLPDGSDRRRMGKWRVTVEFTPDSDEPVYTH